MKATKAYRQAMDAQRDQALRGSSAAPLPGWRQVRQMKPGWTVAGSPAFAAKERAPLSAPARPVSVGRIGSIGGDATAPSTLPLVGTVDWFKIGPALLMNFGISYAMLEIFPSYLKDKLDGRTDLEKRKARWQIILSSAGVLTLVNNVLIPWFASK